MNGESNTNLADLLRQLRDDTTELVREEVRLAKTEASEKLAFIGRNVGNLAIGGFVGMVALLLLLSSLGYLLAHFFEQRGMAPGMSAFLGFFIIAVTVAVISAALIMKAIKAFKSEPITPTKTVQSLQEDKQWAQRKMS
jgi:hypothetical protein